METTNEELQSTNEEMQTINAEMRLRSGELNQANVFLEAILTSLRSAVIVLDQSLCIQIWNRKSEDLWGLRADQALNKPILTLNIRLPVEELMVAIRACLTDRDCHEELTVEAHNQRGKKMQCAVIITPLLAPEGELKGVVLLIEEQPDPLDKLEEIRV